MKTIVIVLLLISFSSAQVPDCKSMAFVETTPFYTKSITICDIMQYAEECYNDTTWVETSLYMRATEMFSHYDFYREDSEDVWLRKTPTLKGFTEWIRSK